MVVGATGDIGQSIAGHLLGHVAVLVVAGRDEEKLAVLVDRLSVASSATRVECCVVNVAEPSSVEKAFQTLFQRHKRMDILINCAGVLLEQGVMFNSADRLQELFAVNTFGCFFTSQFASRLMMRHKQGVIVNVGSVVAQQGAAGQTIYSATKSALEGLTRSLARELAAHNIRVNNVAPGFIATRMVGHYDDSQRQELASKTALGRLGTPEDVAAVVFFLCTKGAAYITGQTLKVDGMMRL